MAIRTNTGRVVYTRDVHMFSWKDVERIMKAIDEVTFWDKLEKILDTITEALIISDFGKIMDGFGTTLNWLLGLLELEPPFKKQVPRGLIKFDQGAFEEMAHWARIVAMARTFLSIIEEKAEKEIS